MSCGCEQATWLYGQVLVGLSGKDIVTASYHTELLASASYPQQDKTAANTAKLSVRGLQQMAACSVAHSRRITAASALPLIMCSIADFNGFD